MVAGSLPKLNVRSPKLAKGPEWYPYYAGYSEDFVEDAIAELGGPGSLTVLDPWNGSGTTTAVAGRGGHQTHGFDLNPALTLIARGRLLGAANVPALAPLAADILRHSQASRGRGNESEGSLLTRLFDAETAETITAISSSICEILVGNPGDGSSGGPEAASPLAALFITALFQAARAIASPYRTTNPTWLKSRGAAPVSVSREIVEREFRHSVAALAKRLKSDEGAGTFDVATAAARELPLEDRTVDLIVTSPPYCTRIDYAVATLPELAVLGLGNRDVTALRTRMLGSPLTTGRHPVDEMGWGPHANSFLHSVEAHGSHASQTYYRRYFASYFGELRASLAEVTRVSRQNAKMAIVVQDSHYKEIRLDLARVVIEMLRPVGWRALARRDLAVRTMASVNPAGRVYRPNTPATESVLAFSRVGGD